MSVVTAWRDMIICFQLAKIAWRDEDRKSLLSAEDMREIDKLFVEMQLIVDSFDYSRRHMNEFMSKQVVLSMLVCEAEQKMGYVSVFNENK